MTARGAPAMATFRTAAAEAKRTPATGSHKKCCSSSCEKKGVQTTSKGFRKGQRWQRRLLGGPYKAQRQRGEEGKRWRPPSEGGATITTVATVVGAMSVSENGGEDGATMSENRREEREEEEVAGNIRFCLNSKTGWTFCCGRAS